MEQFTNILLTKVTLYGLMHYAIVPLVNVFSAWATVNWDCDYQGVWLDSSQEKSSH